MIPAKALYWGDNDAHEFWESEDHELLILRNHEESFWTAHRNCGYLFGCRTEAEAAKRLNVVLSPTRRWAQRNGKFILEATSNK
jgi:hypothetical protein